MVGSGEEAIVVACVVRKRNRPIGKRHVETGDTTAEREAALNRIRRFAKLLDSAFRVPGTNFEMGLEGLVGLIPGVGDFASAVVSLYVPFEAIRMGAPWAKVAQMLLNILIDALVGSVPVVGDLFDVAFKANNRNVRLLEEYLGRSPEDV
ncbi:MAG: DUF4112 domain-containing protein [Bacteroidetes bacterium SW_4_67_19]|nr:MAG: DUF4112 domain-containing protein [Bacteroidetes bacterium SW_4_67_19]